MSVESAGISPPLSVRLGQWAERGALGRKLAIVLTLAAIASAIATYAALTPIRTNVSTVLILLNLDLALFLILATVVARALVRMWIERRRGAVGSRLHTRLVLLFSLIGMGGSYGVAWYGIRINTLANSRTAFASLKGRAFPVYSTPIHAGMSVGTMLVSVELLFMLAILLFIPGDYAGPCFIGFAIGESLGASALRIAGGIFTKIADIGSDLMKIVFNIKEDDARNPGVIADCTGDNAGDSVGPSADGFETYGVTGVAHITFILLAVKDPALHVPLLVWIFVLRVLTLIASALGGTIARTLGPLTGASRRAERQLALAFPEK